MKDIEITRLCAAAMGYTAMPPASPADLVLCVKIPKHPMVPEYPERYDPLYDDAQAMALIKELVKIQGAHIDSIDGKEWCVVIGGYGTDDATNLNRAICDCVARMMQAKKKTT